MREAVSIPIKNGYFSCKFLSADCSLQGRLGSAQWAVLSKKERIVIKIEVRIEIEAGRSADQEI